MKIYIFLRKDETNLMVNQTMAILVGSVYAPILVPRAIPNLLPVHFHKMNPNYRETLPHYPYKT